MRRLLVGVLVCATAAVAGWLFFWPDAEQRAFRQIQPGMTQEQVTQVIGLPDERFPEVRVFLGGRGLWPRDKWGELAPSPNVKSTARWSLENGMIIVAFDKEGRVVGAGLYSWEKRSTFFGQLRETVGW
jgi:hypothetical protein